MKISELSTRSGVPVPTIKFYLREGLLQPGAKSKANQAQYGQNHLERLRLIRSLREVGKLGIEAVRRVVVALDSEAPAYEVMGLTHYALSHRASEREKRPSSHVAAAADSLLAWLSAEGWFVHTQSPAWLDLVDAYMAAKGAWPAEWGSVEPQDLLPYARAARDMALAEMPEGGRVFGGAPPEQVLKYMVLGTVLFEPVILALRRLAQQDRAAKMFRQPPGLI